MTSSTIIPLIPKETLKDVEKKSDKIVRLVEVVRVNIGPIFRAEEEKRTLHTRYLKQRKEKIWKALEEIGVLVKPDSAIPNLQLLLIERVLKIIMVARGKSEDIIESSKIESKASELINKYRGGKDNSGALLVLDIIKESGISMTGLERFLTTTSRQIG